MLRNYRLFRLSYRCNPYIRIYTHRPFNRHLIFNTFQRRNYNYYTSSSAPKLLSFGRIFLGTSGALVAFVSFKVNQLIEWSTDSASNLLLSFINAFNDVMGIGNRISNWFPSDNWISATKRKNKDINNSNTSSFSSPSPSTSQSDSSTHISPHSEFSPLIRHLLEIQEILRIHNLEDRLTLPNVVVLGGQSAGKTSVLEALIGYSFLPKGGAAMVTKRPLHLRLVHDAECVRPFAIFGSSTIEAAPIGPLYDMGHVEAMLRALNAAVDENAGIDETPIYLSLHASNVPDLSLVDLPGFIQVSSKIQAPQLRERIQKLAEYYAQQPNVLLAVSPADVDLANSEALKAAREADPEGERTIGVLSKLDLIHKEPDQAMVTLSKDTADYPLPLGYVGLWATPDLNNGGFIPNGGIPLLRRRLVSALESAMHHRIQSLHSGVSEELAEVELSMRVQFDDDRRISPDAYLAKVLAAATSKVESLANTELSRSSIEQALLEAMRSGSASSSLDGSVGERIKDSRELAGEISTITRSHIGKTASNVIRNVLAKYIDTLTKTDPSFKLHPSLATAAKSACESLLSSKLSFLTLSVEASVKPFRRGTEFNSQEWKESRLILIKNLYQRLSECESKLSYLSNEVGGPRRLRAAVAALEKNNYTSFMGECAREASFLLEQKEEFERRITYLERSSPCNPSALSSSWIWNPLGNGGEATVVIEETNIQQCPDVYLNLLATRLASTAALYLHHEIIHSLLGAFSEQLTASVIKQHSSMSELPFEKRIVLPPSPSSLVPGSHAYSSAALQFAQENPELSVQLKLQAKRDALADVRDRLSYFIFTQPHHHFNKI